MGALNCTSGEAGTLSTGVRAGVCVLWSMGASGLSDGFTRGAENGFKISSELAVSGARVGTLSSIVFSIGSVCALSGAAWSDVKIAHKAEAAPIYHRSCNCRWCAILLIITIRLLFWWSHLLEYFEKRRGLRVIWLKSARAQGSFQQEHRQVLVCAYALQRTP